MGYGKGVPFPPEEGPGKKTNFSERYSCPHGRNHVFKVGVVQFVGLDYCAERSTDGIANFVHCRVQLRKKLGVVRPNFGRTRVGLVQPPPNGCALAPDIASRAQQVLAWSFASINMNTIQPSYPHCLAKKKRKLIAIVGIFTSFRTHI